MVESPFESPVEGSVVGSGVEFPVDPVVLKDDDVIVVLSDEVVHFFCSPVVLINLLYTHGGYL